MTTTPSPLLGLPGAVAGDGVDSVDVKKMEKLFLSLA